MRIHAIHGFNVRDRGEGTVLALAAHLLPLIRHPQPIQLIPCGFGFRFLVRVRLGTRRRAREIASRIRPGDIVIAHSDGCNIADLAAQALPASHKITLIYVNPALNRTMPLAPSVRRCLVYSCPTDLPVRLARWLPLHRWGDMGAFGPARPDPRYISIPYAALGLAPQGHSGVFRHSHPRLTVALDIARRLRS